MRNTHLVRVCPSVGFPLLEIFEQFLYLEEDVQSYSNAMTQARRQIPHLQKAEMSLTAILSDLPACTRHPLLFAVSPHDPCICHPKGAYTVSEVRIPEVLPLVFHPWACICLADSIRWWNPIFPTQKRKKRGKKTDSCPGFAFIPHSLRFVAGAPRTFRDGPGLLCEEGVERGADSRERNAFLLWKGVT